MLDRFVKKINPKKVILVHIDDYSHYEMSKAQVSNAGYEPVYPGEWIV